MYQQLSVRSETSGQIKIIRLKGYLEDTGGTLLKQAVQEGLDGGLSLFALDCREIELISSPGVAALLDIAGLVADDFAGQVCVWGLDKHHATVLEMSGFFFLAHQVSSESECLEFLNDC